MKKTKSDQKKNIPIDRHPLHPEKRLVTRRDFLSSGLLASAAAVMLPTALDIVLFERAARAGDCPAGGGLPGMIPFLIFDCAGGASLSGNWVVSDTEGKGGQPLPSYSKLGLGDTSQFVVDTQFGAPMAGPIALNPTMFSRVFQVLTDDTQLPANIRACLRMGVIAHTSLSDSQVNQLSSISLVTAAGLQGSRIKNGLGTRNSNSAGNSDVASLNPVYRPMGISSVDSLAVALSYGPAFSSLPTKVRDALANGLMRLSTSQLNRLSAMRLGDQFAALAECGYLKNMEYTVPGNSVDARQDPTVAAIYGITTGSSASSSMVVEATLVKNAIEKASGPAVITIGGCDYHTGDQTTGDNKDTEIGQHIARALRVAFAKGTPVAFQLSTDGGIYSDDGTRVWRGDDNDKSLTVFGIMDPAGPREMVATQLGRYTTGQGADRNHFLGTDPKRVAHTVALNYLAVCGQVSRYPSVAITDPLPSDRLSSLLLFPNKA